MTGKLPVKTSSELVLEQRIPEGFSATAEEHTWHRCPTAAPVDVTTATAGAALQRAEALRAAAPERRDTEYRVVLRTVEITGWVLP